MDVAALVLFASTLLLAAASPGPGVAALVARVVGRGARGAGAFAAGLILGDLVWLAVAILGLAVVAQTFHEVFLVIKYAGAGYLAYLAYRMWTAPIRPREVAGDTRRDGYVRLFFAGLAVTLGNPKVVAFYLALLPTLIDLPRVGPVRLRRACRHQRRHSDGRFRRLCPCGGARANPVSQHPRHASAQPRRRHDDGRRSRGGGGEIGQTGAT